MGAVERSRAAKRVRGSEVIHRPLAAVTFIAGNIKALRRVFTPDALDLLHE
jgi:hypothetical protein